MPRLPAALLCLAPLLAAATPDAPDPLAGLRPGHPRLIATPDDWTYLAARLGSDPLLRAQHEGLLAQAREILPLPPVTRVLTGRRLLSVSRTLLARVTTLGYAWRLTGDRAFVERAEAEMLAAAAFSDWNPSHFLDVAEATAALALGYDWCHDGLSPAARARIREAIVTKGVQPGLDPEARHNRWHRNRHNWNQVCFGGLTLGVLAIAEDEPELARRLLTLARDGIGHGLAPYAPDGVYPEGPSYWIYGTSYQVLMIAGLESALGTDWGLAASPGFLPSVHAFLQATAPSGRFYNFADGGEGGGLVSVVYWFARKLDDPGLLLFNRRALESGSMARGNRFSPLVALWWPDRAAAEPTLPLHWQGRGPNPIGVFRESWSDPAALYVAFKGGSADLNHAHMDAGSFILEADGVRWAIDLGAQEYNSLESKGISLFGRTQDAQRWGVYRLNNLSHSTLTIGGQHHRVEGRARITHFAADPGSPRALVDLTPVFGGQAGSVRRGFQVLPGRRVLIQDELTGLAPGTRVRWQMPTRAQVTVNGTNAHLAEQGQTLHARLLADGGAFTVGPADPPADDFNAPNPGVSLLAVDLVAPANGTLRIAVVLAPGPQPSAGPELVPLDEWATSLPPVPAP